MINYQEYGELLKSEMPLVTAEKDKAGVKKLEREIKNNFEALSMSGLE